MASTAAAARRRSPGRSGSRPARAPRRRRGPGIRWDRVGRVALLLVLGLIVLLYIGPLHSAWTTWNQSKERKAEVVRLEAEHKRLLERKQGLQNPATLEREARRLGMVRPGERAYIVASQATPER